MPINTRELMNAVAVVADEQNVRITVRQSGKAAIMTGASTFVGGVLGGPIGIALGAIFGGVGSAIKFSGTFKPLSEILRNDLTDQERDRLREHIVNAVRDIHPTDLAVLIPLILGDASVQMAVMRTVTSFVTNEMGLAIVD